MSVFIKDQPSDGEVQSMSLNFTKNKVEFAPMNEPAAQEPSDIADGYADSSAYAFEA